MAKPWTANDVEKDHVKQMRRINRDERMRRAMTIDRDLDRLSEAKMGELGEMPIRQQFIEMGRVKRNAHREVYEAEAVRRNELESRPVVGYFLQIGPVCINIGGEDRVWKINRKCIFCGNFFSVCIWHHWNVAAGVMRARTAAKPPT